MLFIYNKFKLRKWSKYSSVKRLKILQALENKLAKQNHRDPIDVVVHENSNWNCFGINNSYSFSSIWISIYKLVKRSE